MYRPQITNINTALTIFYKYAEIGNKEMNDLFGSRSSATISRLKKSVRAEMFKRNMPIYTANKINTKIAFSVWGIDVLDLEERQRKIIELSLN